MDSPRLSVHTLSLSGPSSLVFISFVPSLGPLTCPVGFVATYLLGCFIEAMLAVGGLYVRMVAVHQLTAYNALAFCRFRCFPYLSQHNKYWWPMCQDGGSASAHYCPQCFGDLPTSVLFSAKASVGGLFVRMVAVLRLTTASNALAKYLEMVAVLQLTTAHNASATQRQALVAYLSGWWQCFGSLLPAMLWRPTDLPTSVLPRTLSAQQVLVAYVSGWWQCFSSLLPTMLRRPTYFGALFSKGKRWWPMCQDGGSASAHYCQQCFGDLPTSVLPLTLSAEASAGGPHVSGLWQRFGSLLPTMLWRPTYFGVSAYSFSKGKRWLSTRQKSGSASAHTGTQLCLKNMARNKRLEPAQESAQSWMSVLRKPLKTDKPRGFTFSWAARLVFFLLIR